jgi:hypothetical protein
LILRDANDNVFHVHFTHVKLDERYYNRRMERRMSPNRWWMETRCILHAGECAPHHKDSACNTAGGHTGVSRCSRLDNFNRRKGLKVSFERALNAMYPHSEDAHIDVENAVMRTQLWAAFWSRVRPPKGGS